MFAPDGSRRLWQENVQADMRGKRYEHFTVSGDGLRVRFGLKQWSEEPILFDLAAERLSDTADILQDLHQADTDSLDIKDWISNTNPKLGGVPIKLEEYEWARSLAIAPDKQRFVLGTEWYLRGHDKDGKELWPPKQVPDVVWGVNIPRDGKLVVVAYGDGTIRWHRLSDGQELLALFVHAKDRRWVAWTPKGYYTASPGGESLIGWHINRGWNDAADFFPAYRFRKQFYRPDIVERILGDLDEDKAIKQANLAADRGRGEEDIARQLPPVVAILSPLEGSALAGDDVTVEYTLRSPSGLPVTRVTAQVNGSLAATDRQVTGRLRPADKLVRQIKVAVPREGEVTLALTAWSGDRASEPADVTLRAKAGAAAVRELPTLYALVVGVGDYRKDALNLPASTKDAQEFADRLRKQKGRAFKDVVFFQDKVLLNGDATKQAILQGAEWLKTKTSGSDLALMYFSGHGTTKSTQASYLVPYDYDLESNRTLVHKGELLDLLGEIGGKVLLFIDACMATDGLSALRPQLVLGRLEAPESRIMAFASSLAGEVSRADLQLSYFTRALIEAFDGKIAGKAVIKPRDLDHWLEFRVAELSGKKQLPKVFKPAGDSARFFAELTLAVVQ
jgi:hypothetical protein